MAVLGILLLNVRLFAMPNAAYQYPVALDATVGDLWAYALTTVLAQGKFISIFAALYGAGIILATRRLDTAGADAFATYRRRSAILAGVGLLHMFLIWYGDILFAYAVIGLLAFSLRKLATRWLWTIAVAGLLTTASLMLLLAVVMWAGVRYGGQDPIVIIGGPEAWQAEIDAYRGGFASELAQRSATAAFMLPSLLILFSPQLLGLMAAGMALLRNGFLTGDWSARRYVTAGLAGVVFGIGGCAALTAWAAAEGWPILGWFGFGQAFLLIFSPPAAFGIASLWIGHVASGRTPWATRVFAAVGRMAFTNYLTQSLLGFLFFYTFDWFGHVGYLRQLLFVAVVWALQLAWSVLWLSQFRFGPLEWIWRGLTYGQFPQLRRGELAVASSAHGK